MTDEELSQWLEAEVWRLVRLSKKASTQDNFVEFVPPSNSLRDHELRRSVPGWWVLSVTDRQWWIKKVIDELIQLHRLKPQGREKLSWYTPLSEVEALDSLSRV